MISRPRLFAVLLALVTLMVYLPVTHYGFINYDDDDYVTNNQVVQNGLTLSGFKWAFMGFHASNWHPLTWLSHMTDCELFGLNAGGHHFVSVLFHVANTVLLLTLMFRLTGALWPSAYVAALFAWHPLHVESVAWIAERKDVLSSFFALLALLAYTRFVQKPAITRSRLLPSALRPLTSCFYLLALLFFAFSLMAKPMFVTLPFVMLLLDYWPLQRVSFPPTRNSLLATVLEKLPFFLLTVISCIVTCFAQPVLSIKTVSLSYRVENLPVAYAGYLQKLFWPADLAIIYPMPEKISTLAVGIAVSVLLFISAGVGLARKRSPYLIVGWLWFLGMLVPVIGLVQVGGAALADRYTYFPAIGIFFAIAFGTRELTNRFQFPKAAAATAASLVLVSCLILTKNQLHFWRDSEMLFTHTLAVTKNNDIAHGNLGIAFEQQQKWDEALVQYHEALRISPGRYQTRNNLGNILDHLGKPAEAMAEYQAAISLNPQLAFLHNSLGGTLTELGRFNEAMTEFTNAMSLDPAASPPHVLLGGALLKVGRDGEAIGQFREALKLDPLNSQTLAYTAYILSANENAAARDGRAALVLATKANVLTGGNQPMVFDVLGMAYAETGDYTNAETCAQNAIILATAAQMKNFEPIRQRLALYKNHTPWRESFQAAQPATKQ
jgi:tetratricopeptide (TPR) repeat protein